MQRDIVDAEPGQQAVLSAGESDAIMASPSVNDDVACRAVSRVPEEYPVVGVYDRHIMHPAVVCRVEAYGILSRFVVVALILHDGEVDGEVWPKESTQLQFRYRDKMSD